MTSKISFNHYLKVLAGSFFCGVALVVLPSTIKAATCTSNPARLSTSCTITPERYVITIYEMGLCTSDPLSSTNLDTSSCISTLVSADGISGDIAGATLPLNDGVSPQSGTYNYAYVMPGFLLILLGLQT